MSDFTKFAKLNEPLIKAMDDVLSTDIPKLMKMFPEVQQKQKIQNLNLNLFF